MMSSCKRVEPLASTTLAWSAARTLLCARSLGYTKYSRFNLSSASSASGQPSSRSVYQLFNLYHQLQKARNTFLLVPRLDKLIPYTIIPLCRRHSPCKQQIIKYSSMRDINIFKSLASLAASLNLFKEACAPLDGELR